MILSAHRFTGFWFESSGNNLLNEKSASTFLAASLDCLRNSNSGKGQAKGAINSNFDPSRLSSDVPGYAWLKDRLKWIKRTYRAFDDQPSAVLKDSERRRNPFPAFHLTIRYQVGGQPLALDGVEVLIGHDFAVVHEFTISPKPVSDPDGTYGKLTNKRFAIRPDPSATLFTAEFCQLSGPRANKPMNAWSPMEFAAGDYPRRKDPVRCAVRADERCYEGCILIDKAPVTGSQSQGLYHAIADHVNASGYLKFFCILLVNDAKVLLEYAVASRALTGLKSNLDLRSKQAEALAQADYGLTKRTASRTSLDALRAAHWADGKLLDHFDQLVRTCTINARQFAQVASQLLESDNQWSAAVRRRLKASSKKLRAAQLALRDRFRSTAERVDEMPRARDERKRPQRTVRDKIFISYAHEDKKWLAELKKHLSPVLRTHKLFGTDESEMIWDDTRIGKGDKWREEINAALAGAKAAISLVTPDFLASDFINLEEIPKLLLAQKKADMFLFWIHISASNYKFTVLEGYQFLGDPDKPLDGMAKPRRNKEWVTICTQISETTDLWRK